MPSLFKFLSNISARLGALLTMLFCGYLLIFAFVLEYFVDLTPCPLCIAQRIFFFLIGLTAAAFLVFPKTVTEKIIALKITAFALIGGAIAIRQVWLQWYPGAIDPTRCGVSFGSFIDQFLLALGGTGDCAKVDWTWLTLSIAEWSALSFALLLFVGIWFTYKAFFQSRV